MWKAKHMAWCAACVVQGSIDQVEGLIRFDGATEELLQWDLQIQGICHAANAIIDGLAAKGMKMAAV
jgi:COP9 signalosome complex subunit 4